MSKSSVTLLFIGLSLLVVCDGSPVSHESSESFEIDTTGISGFSLNLPANCESNTGSDAVFATVMKSVERTSICLSKFDTVMQSLKNDFNQMTNETRTAFFTKYCSVGRSLLSCLNDVPASLRPCLKERGLNILNATYNVLPEALDFACKNDGEVIFKLKDKSRHDCLSQKFDQLLVCARTLKRSLNVEGDFSELTQDQCSILTNYRECLKDTMDACDLSDIVSIYDMIMNPILRLSHCVNNTENPKTGETDENNSTAEV